MAHWRNHRDFKGLVEMGTAGNEAENVGRGRAGRSGLQERAWVPFWKLWEVRRGINQDLM